MVKIPGLDDLKKMGSDLIDSAKTVNLSGVVDKIKGGMESAGSKKTATSETGDPLAERVQEAQTTFAELLAVQNQQAQLIKKLQNQLAEMSKIAATYQKPLQPEQPQDEKKS